MSQVVNDAPMNAESKMVVPARVSWTGFFVNWGLWPLYLLGVGPFRKLDIDQICEQASKETGLTDFGDPFFKENFRRIFNQLPNVPLSPFGCMLLRGTTLRQMRTKLQLVDAIKKNPELLERPIRRPIFVMGIPRTGTTLLHRLLALDPNCRTPKTWEMFFPLPFVEQDTYETDPRIEQCDNNIMLAQVIAPHLAGIHPLGARNHEECLYALGQDLSFTPATFGTIVQDPYFSHLNPVPTYTGYYKLLQVLQYKFPPKDHWTLKCPAHLWYLNALLTAFPDARIIWTHRDPLKCIPSTCSLFAVFDDITKNSVEMDTLGRTMLETWGRKVKETHEIVQRLPKEQIYHVKYENTVKTPIETIKSIYHQLGYEYTDEYDKILRDFLAKDKEDRQKHAKVLHNYSVEEFGLTQQEVIDTFAWYTKEYDVPPEKQHIR